MGKNIRYDNIADRNATVEVSKESKGGSSQVDGVEVQEVEDGDVKGALLRQSKTDRQIDGRTHRQTHRHEQLSNRPKPLGSIQLMMRKE